MAGWYPYGSYRYPPEQGPYPPPYQAGYGAGNPQTFPGMPNIGNGPYGMGNSPYTPPVPPPFPTQPTFPTQPAFPQQPAFPPQPAFPTPPVLPPPPPVAAYPPVQYSNNYNAYNNQPQYIPYPVQYVGTAIPQTEVSTTRPTTDLGTAFFHCAYPGCGFFSEHQSDIVHHWKVHFPPCEPAYCSSKSCRHKKRHTIEHRERLHDHIGKILAKPK